MFPAPHAPQENGDSGGSDPGNARSCAEGGWPRLFQFASDLRGKTRDDLIVEVFRNEEFFIPAEGLDVGILPS